MKVFNHKLIGTYIRCYTVWEPYAGHSTINYSDYGYKKAGRVGTDPLPPEIDALPTGDERSKAVRAFFAQRYERAYAAIYAQHPELKNVAQRKEEMGEIVIWEE